MLRALRYLVVAAIASINEAIDMLATGRLDAFATNKPTLFEMSGELRGSRVLPGSYGTETFAIGIPKGRRAAMCFVNRFVDEARAQGTIARAVERAGLRGAAP
jgi:polar amino acid transport system substrate-binding protein